MDRESLEALFVGRESVMADVVNRLSDSVMRKGEKHYLLLVGPRGSGKTHFVALAHHRIRSELQSRGLSDSVLVAFLNEEEWGVASYLDFLVRILRALAVECDELGDKIGYVYTKFAKDPRRAESLAERLISDHVRGKTLLLLCENLIDLFDGLEEEGQRRWRSCLQETGYWAVLATTPKLFSALTLQEHPFFGFFTIRELKALDYDTAHQLLVKKALHDEQPELAAFLSTPIGRARIRAVHHVAEGNHRAYVILYDFLDRQSLDDLVDPFMHMVDDLTPYYQDRMRQLAPAQRKIVEFLCHRSEPHTVKEIASSCLMSQQTAAKQLGELEGAGFIRRTSIGRQTFCELAEPLMRICIEVKDNRTEHFRLFIEFLRHWFSSREIEQKVSILESTAHSKMMDAVHFKEALRCARSAATEPFLEALQEGLERYEEAIEAAKGELRLNPEHWHSYDKILEALIMLERHEDAESEANALVERAPNSARPLVCASYAFYMLEKCDRAIELTNRAIALEPKNIDARYCRGLSYFKLRNHKAASADLKYVVSAWPDSVGAHCRLSDALMSIGDYEGALPVAERLIELDPTHEHAYLVLAGALFALNRPGEGFDALERLLGCDDVKTLALGAEIACGENNIDLALKLVAKAVAIAPDDPDVWEVQAAIDGHRTRFDDAWAAALKASQLGKVALACQPELLRREAGISPLERVFSRLSAFRVNMNLSEARETTVEGVVGAMVESVREYGPQYLFTGMLKLHDLLEDKSWLGEVLTVFVTKALSCLRGSLEGWECVLAELDKRLSGIRACTIPLAVLASAVRFIKTNDQRFLLQLPLEQRQLLQGAIAKPGVED